MCLQKQVLHRKLFRLIPRFFVETKSQNFQFLIYNASNTALNYAKNYTVCSTSCYIMSIICRNRGNRFRFTSHNEAQLILLWIALSQQRLMVSGIQIKIHNFYVIFQYALTFAEF